jgi:hypothetical protein
MAVGVEAMFVGAVLKREPHTGVIIIDAMARSATVNGHPAKLALAGYLNDWITAELRRKALDSSWVSGAVITIGYSWQPGGRGRAPWADFAADALVVSVAGEASGRYANTQPLVGA